MALDTRKVTFSLPEYAGRHITIWRMPVTWTDGDDVLPPKKYGVDLDANGAGDVTLPTTDDAQASCYYFAIYPGKDKDGAASESPHVSLPEGATDITWADLCSLYATETSATNSAAAAYTDAHAALTGTGPHGAASANTASAIVTRDASGNFAAGTVSAGAYDHGGAGYNVHSSRLSTVAVGDGTADDRAALAAADALGPAEGSPGKTYRIASNLTLANGWRPNGSKLKPASGVTVTVSGPVEAGLYQWIDTSLGGVVAGAGFTAWARSTIERTSAAAVAFNADGTITETLEDGGSRTTTISGSTITQAVTTPHALTLTTTIAADGSITEVVT